MNTLVKDGRKNAKGYKPFALNIEGYALSFREMVIAKCFDCCGGFSDSTEDCEVISCPCYQGMPYRKLKLDLKPKKDRPKKELSEKQKENLVKMLSANLVKSSD